MKCKSWLKPSRIWDLGSLVLFSEHLLKFTSKLRGGFALGPKTDLGPILSAFADAKPRFCSKQSLISVVTGASRHVESIQLLVCSFKHHLPVPRPITRLYLTNFEKVHVMMMIFLLLVGVRFGQF